MPQSAQEHGDDEIGILADFAFAVAAQRDIEIVAQPTGKGCLLYTSRCV